MPNLACLPGSVPARVEWIEYGGFIPICLGVIGLFWGFAFICEEYCVPAITVFCKRYKFSDDVAGAIFIGSGLSLPSVFASYIGLFGSNSAIGVGTVIGGDIFNHLINIAGSIMVAPNYTLKLDKVVLTREVFFYLISTVLLIWAVKGNIYPSITTTFIQTSWVDCLTINWYNSFVLLMGYVFYCIVVVNFDRIHNYIKSFRNIELPCCHDNGHILVRSSEQVGVSGSSHSQDDIEGYVSLNNRNNTNPSESQAVESADSENNNDTRPALSTQTTVSLRPPLPPLEITERYVEVILFKKSNFFSRYNFGCVPSSRLYKLRYFTLDSNGLSYRIHQEQPRIGSHIHFINLFEAESVKILNHLSYEFMITMKNKQSYILRATEVETLYDVVEFTEDFLANLQHKPEEQIRMMSRAAV